MCLATSQPIGKQDQLLKYVWNDPVLRKLSELDRILHISKIVSMFIVSANQETEAGD